eukprot:286449_1
MSTHALITILAYLVLNIQNTNSMVQAPFSVTLNMAAAQFEAYQGPATPSEATHMLLDTLLEHGLKPESEPSAPPSQSPVSVPEPGPPGSTPEPSGPAPGP